MNELEQQKLTNLVRDGRLILTTISNEINNQSFIKSAEAIGKTLSMDLETHDRDWLWQAGGIMKGMLPSPIENILEQYVGWYMDCVLFYREMHWMAAPRVIRFIDARKELSNELQRGGTSLNVALRIIGKQVEDAVVLLKQPPEEKISADTSWTNSAKIRAVLVVIYLLGCVIVNLSVAQLVPLELLIAIIGSEIAIITVLVMLWNFIKSGN